jgi:O-antigen ligase
VISLGIFGVICLWDFFSEKNRFRLLGFILFSFGTIVFIKNIDTILENIMYRMYSTEMLDGSSRYGIWYNALRALVNTGFMGTGIGGLQAEMRKVGSFYDIPITHNMFLEVLTQFGVLIFVPFIIGLYRLVSRIFQISNVDKKRVLIAATLAMPFYFIVNSGYLLSCSFYAYFASLFVFAYITTDNKRCRDRS